MKKLTRVGYMSLALAMTMLAGVPDIFASGGVTGGASQSQIIADMQKIIDVLDGFGLPYVQAGVALAIAVFVIIGIVKASRAKNTKAIWMEASFGLLGIVFVVNPILLINAFIHVSSWFGGGAGTGTTNGSAGN